MCLVGVQYLYMTKFALPGGYILVRRILHFCNITPSIRGAELSLSSWLKPNKDIAS